MSAVLHLCTLEKDNMLREYSYVTKAIPQCLYVVPFFSAKIIVIEGLLGPRHTDNILLNALRNVKLKHFICEIVH